MINDLELQLKKQYLFRCLLFLYLVIWWPKKVGHDIWMKSSSHDRSVIQLGLYITFLNLTLHYILKFNSMYFFDFSPLTYFRVSWRRWCWANALEWCLFFHTARKYLVSSSEYIFYHSFFSSINRSTIKTSLQKWKIDVRFTGLNSDYVFFSCRARTFCWHRPIRHCHSKCWLNIIT